MQSIILQYLTEWGIWAYLLIFLGMIVEGDILLFTTGFLVHQGYLEFQLAATAIFFGVLAGDILWYRLGKALTNQQSFLSRWTEKLAKPFDGHLINRPLRTLLVSKFAYGLHHAILIRAGVMRLDFLEFIKDDVVAAVGWITVIAGLGWFSSASFFLIQHYIRYVERALLLGIIIFVAISHIMSRISLKEL